MSDNSEELQVHKPTEDAMVSACMQSAANHKKRAAFEMAEAMYWRMSTAKKGIDSALSYLWEAAEQIMKREAKLTKEETILIMAEAILKIHPSTNKSTMEELKDSACYEYVMADATAAYNALAEKLGEIA